MWPQHYDKVTTYLALYRGCSLHRHARRLLSWQLGFEARTRQ